MNFIGAHNTPWAYQTNLDSTHTFAVTRAQIVNLHRKEGEKDLQCQSCAWLAISSPVNDQCEVIDLKQHAEVNEWAKFATNEHGSFNKQQATSD